jgi:hypothetical protein
VLNIQFEGRPSILKGVCITNNILFTGMNLWLRVIELHKRTVPIQPFLRQLRETFVLNIQFEGRPSILKGVCITKSISFTGMNLWLLVIELHKKNGSNSAIFETVRETFVLNIQLEGRQLILKGVYITKKYFIHGHEPLAILREF